MEHGINREDLDKEREFVERRLSELDRRRDAGLTDKLAAIEKLFQAIVATKSDAISIAVSRIQGDSKECVTRCATQVRIFYDLIHDVKDDNLRHTMTIEMVRAHVKDIEDEFAKELKEIETHLTVTDANVAALVTSIALLTTNIDKWRTNFWTVNIPAICALALATTLSILTGWAWVLDYIKKQHGG